MGNIVIEGVVFDLDATLVDLGEHVRWREAQGEIVQIYRACGCSEEDLARCSSRGLFNMMHEVENLITPSMPSSELRDLQERISKILEGYEKEGVELCGLMPGTEKTLSWLRSEGIRLGICTSNSTQVARLVLQRLGVGSLFSSVIGRTPGLRMKPHPDQVVACFEEMGVKPVNGVMVGDSHNDVLAGKAAGARTVAIPVCFTHKEALEAAKPDAVINSMDEFPDTILAFK